MFAVRNLSLALLALAAVSNPILAAEDAEKESDFVHEWAAVFPVDDATHMYHMQEVGGSYADPNMKIVVIPTTQMDIEGIHTTEGGVAALMEGDSCEVIENGGTGSAIAETGSCFDLVVDESIDTNTFNLVTEGLTGVAVYTQHVPYEFERDTHFFQDSSGADVEPTAEETMEGGHAHGHGHGHEGHGSSDDEVSGAAGLGGLVGSAFAGAIVAAAL